MSERMTWTGFANLAVLWIDTTVNSHDKLFSSLRVVIPIGTLKPGNFKAPTYAYGSKTHGEWQQKITVPNTSNSDSGWSDGREYCAGRPSYRITSINIAALSSPVDAAPTEIPSRSAGARTFRATSGFGRDPRSPPPCQEAAAVPSRNPSELDEKWFND